MQGWIVTRAAADGSKRYDAKWRVGSKIKGKTFTKRKAADTYLAGVVGAVQRGEYSEPQPVLMSFVFEEWQRLSLDVRVAEGTIKISTAKSYRSMIREHLMVAFGALRSDRLELAVVEQWRAGLAKKIAAGTLSAKTLGNLRNLLHVILMWARRPERRYVTQDPTAGLERLRLPRAKVRPHFEPEQVAELLRVAAQSPPDDTIIRLAALSGLRRGELFALAWNDVEPGDEGGRLHVRQRIYQGDLSSPKTDGSDRVVDVPQRLLDDLAVYRAMHPPIGEGGYIFRGPTGRPLDADNWHKRRLVPILKAAGLRLPRTGLHSLRHSYVSMLAAQGEDLHYISRQVGHGSTRLTEDVYRHVLKATRTSAMQRLNEAIPCSNHVADPAGPA